MYRKTLSFILALSLGGCANSVSRHVDIFTIKSDIAAAAKEQENVKGKYSVSVALPKSSYNISSRDIIYSKGGYDKDIYNYSKWSDTPNKMLQQKLVTVLGSMGLFASVSPSSISTYSDYRLESEILEFYHLVKKGETKGGAAVKFYLIENKSNRVVDSVVFKESTPSASDNAKEGVTAINKSVDGILKSLKEWLAASL